MNCIVCSQNNWKPEFHQITQPDKYELAVGLSSINRQWMRCGNCGFVQQDRNYDLSDLEIIYKRTYRSKDFRGETIEEAFARLYALDEDKSENARRVAYLNGILKMLPTIYSLLDIGSGIGIFPYEMSKYIHHVRAIEKNDFSKGFFQEKLNLYEPSKDQKFDIVSLVHVLEHIEDPDSFLKDIKKYMKPGTYLFIEVPCGDSSIDNPADHDDYNSCHVGIYNEDTLSKLISKNGFNPLTCQNVHYRDRNLNRLFLLSEFIK